MDPYKILGVSPNDSDEKIKQAYREMARKYHPDQYSDNPLSDLAAEKMKEINEAYDIIVKQRATGSAGGGPQRQSYSGGGSVAFSSVRRMIDMGDIDGAEIALNSIGERSAEWYFLRGIIDYQRGWFDQARQNINMAINMDPGNHEYQRAMSLMTNRTTQYGSYGSQNYGCSPCDLCTSLLCADLMCSCCGGGCR